MHERGWPTSVGATIGDVQIGQVLAGSPTGADGAWPAEPVRDLIESLATSGVEHGLEVGVLNRRGQTVRGTDDGGGQGWALAEQYRAWAAITRARAANDAGTPSPRRDYESDARREDDEARLRRDTG